MVYRKVRQKSLLVRWAPVKLIECRVLTEKGTRLLNVKYVEINLFWYCTILAKCVLISCVCMCATVIRSRSLR